MEHPFVFPFSFPLSFPLPPPPSCGSNLNPPGGFNPKLAWGPTLHSLDLTHPPTPLEVQPYTLAGGPTPNPPWVFQASCSEVGTELNWNTPLFLAASSWLSAAGIAPDSPGRAYGGAGPARAFFLPVGSGEESVPP